jgi:hypothetical protein
MMKWICTILSLFSALAFAQQANTNSCWKTELNYTTNKVYTSEKLYNAHRAYWSTFNKVTPDPISLSKAYFVYKAEIKRTEKFSKDKLKHCYMGCRISKEIDLPTAKYVAWSKEMDDINDCKIKSHFEIKDYEATVDGAQNPGSPRVCEKYCLTHW